VSKQPRYIPTDRQLVDPVLDGDTPAFGEIISMTEGLVAQIVCRLISNEEDRKDIVQDIYLKVFHHLKGFRFQSKLSTWVAQIAYNTCSSYLQKKRLPLHVLPDGELDGKGAGPGSGRSNTIRAAEETDEPTLQKELTGILQAEIGQLPPLYQTLVGLYHQEELTYQEMARITGLPEGTVKSYLFRARKMLKEKLLSKYKMEKL
jgi:RNA polymerase sigma-70 factor (ECF subfamily)